MAEAVAAGLLTSAAFVGVAKEKLGSAIADQANSMWRNSFFGDDLGDMKDVLETISASLEDAERRSVKEKLVRMWLKRLKDVALDISDMLQDYQEGTSSGDDQTAAKSPGVLSCTAVGYKKIAMANRMKSLRKKLSKISMEFENFKFTITQGTSTTLLQNYDNRDTASSAYLPEVKGRCGDKQEIINLLCASSIYNDERETVIVPIYGLGGMGKSTLAQSIFNDFHFKEYSHRIWVYVSQDFNLLQIGSSIISQLQIKGGQQTGDHMNMDLQAINQCLDHLLHDKTVLIVLDDLWEEDDIELSKLKSMLLVGKKGSMVSVIVTTRDEGIARKVSTSEPYKLQPLKDDICWEIIKMSSKCNQREFELIGLDIAKRCRGVALAAQALGCILQSKDLSEWEKINDSHIWNETSKDSVLPSLKLSYQRMPQQLRICFSYCAIFSKGHNIVEDDLIYQWSALGFIEISKGKEYIKQLLGLSFLQVSKLPSIAYEEHLVCYTMHDMVHDLAKLTMADELIVLDVVPRRYKRAYKYCHYSLLRKYDKTMKLANMPSKVRALCFSDRGELDIQSGAFSFAKCLRTLDFSECSGILLPASINTLKQLRCLIAPRMRNDSLPECITELSKLQYLNLNGSSKISALPESIGKLACLKYLGLSGCSGISKLPESFGDLKHMVHLDMSGCAEIRELPDSFGNLTNLQHLELAGCSGISKLPESFCDLKCMLHLDMSGCSGIRELPGSSLVNFKNLQHIELSGCSRVQAIPESLCGLTQLQYLNLSSCCCLDQIPGAIGSLVNLKYLNMSSCDKIRELPLKKLQNLLHLNLSGCHNMGEGSLGELCGLTTLQHLDISWIWRISNDALLHGLGHLTSLKYLSLSNCGLTGLFVKEGDDDIIRTLTNLEHLDISQNVGFACLPESIGNLKRLHTLDVRGCYALKSLPESIGAVGLKTLVLDGCSDELMDQASSLVHYSQTLPVFKVRADDDDVFNGSSSLPLLQAVHDVELRIRCLESVRSLEEADKVELSEKYLCELELAWTEGAARHLEDKDLLGHLVPPRDLENICLKGYSSTSFPGWLMGISDHVTSLVFVELLDLPTCTNLPPLGQLQHLKYLVCSNLPSVKVIDREFCGGKGAFPRLTSFSITDMFGLEKWNTTYSAAEEDGADEEEEEFMFPVLESLMIFTCPRLKWKPCPPTFRECGIYGSDQLVAFSLEQVVVDETCSSHHRCRCSPSPATKLHLQMHSDSCLNMRILQHFPALRELSIDGGYLTSVPEISMRDLTPALESLTLKWCYGRLSGLLPEWLGGLSSLGSLLIHGCHGIKCLPPCIQKLTKLQRLEIRYNQDLKEWCESEENRPKLAHINDLES